VVGERLSVELRPLDDSHYDLLQSLEEQDDVWEFVGPLLIPQEGSHLFAIVEGQTPLGIGGIVPSPTVPGNEFELVCALRSEAQAHGLALRACQLLLGWAFNTAKLDHVITCIDDRNEGARTVAIKLGMSERGPILPGRTVYVKHREGQ
jgi:RimJ/RimL family protein N-acetyltransferase